MTPTKAREFIAGTFGPARARSVITKLADQVEALTKERDELQKQVDDFCMNYRMKTDVEIKKLTQERDALAAAADSHKVVRDTLTARLHVLEAAAKLALDAMHSVNYAVANGAITADVHVFLRGMSALRQAGVQ